MKQEHEMTPGVLVSGDDMSAGDYKARCAVLEAEMADHERLQAETERLQADRAADKARIAELTEALTECAASLAWNCFGECRAVHDGPIMPAAGALDMARKALSKQGKDSN